MPAEAPSEQEEQLGEQPEESKSAARRVLEQVGNTLEKAKDLAGKVFGEIADHEETMARGMSAGMVAEKPVKSMLARPDTKVAKGTPAHSDAKVVKTCGGFQAPLMVFSDFYEKQMVEDPPVNRGSAPTPVPEPDSEPEAETEQTEESPKEQTVTEVETYKMPQIPLPDGLPRPGVPKKPSWWEIGWRRLMGRSVNGTIWDRWYPPEPSNYAELVCPCKDYVCLGEISEEEFNRLNFELKELSSMMADSQEDDLQDEVEVGVAINRGTSGGIKVLSGTIMIVGSVAGIAAVAASGGTALPVVVMALGTAMIMFGASDTIEGIGDIQAAISRQGLDQMSYNPVRESVFGGNETAYALTETGVSLAFDVITGMAVAKMPTRLKTPAQAFRATSAAGVAKESGAAASEANGTVWNFIKETQPSREGSIIPKSFEIQAGGNRYWVAPNATEHMYEYSTKHLSVTATELSISPSQRMVEQTLLSSFQRAVEEASRIGYTLDDAIRVGNWELAFSKPRKEGLLTAIIHAVYKPKWS